MERNGRLVVATLKHFQTQISTGRGEKCQKTERTMRTILTVNRNQKCFSQMFFFSDSGEGPEEGQEGELDAMMGELTMDELKAAFRLYN